MRNLLLYFLVLFVVTMASPTSAQNVTSSAGRNARSGAQFNVGQPALGVGSTTPQARIQAPIRSIENRQIQFSPTSTNYRPQSGGALLPTAACGPDTLDYPLFKATGLRVLSFSDSLAFGQWYEAPQPITVHGMSFYAWVDSLTNQTVTLTCRLYNAGPDSLPLGAPLASTNIVIDSNFYGGNLGLLEKSVSWAPVVVNAPYVVTVENNTQISCAFVLNDYQANDGQGEWLGHIYLPGGPSAWYHGYEINIGPFDYDADNFIMPHVTYSLTAAYQPNPGSGCVGVPTAFLNQSSPVAFSRFYNFSAAIGVNDSSFYWNYGDGSPVDAVINGNHTYASTGSFTVNLRDTIYTWRGGNCADQVSGTVTILNGVAVNTNYSYTSAGLNANFTDLSTGSPLAWLWDFGDGGTSNLQNPSHTYTANGSYTVCLVAANACGADTICQTVLIGGLPSGGCDTIGNITGTPTIYLDPNGGYISGHNSFADSAKAEKFTLGGAFAFQEALYWFGLKRSPTPLTSKVIATVWDATGPGGSPGAVMATQDLFYNDIDTVGGAALTSVLFPSVVQTNGNFFVGIQLIYTTGDTVALVTNTDPQTNPATAWELFQGGSPWVPLDDAQSWGLAISYAIWVVQTVEADFNNSVSGLTANFTDQSIGATGWLWDFGDGNTSTLQNPSHTYASAGTYNVCLVALNNTCSDTLCQTVTVSSGCPNPNAAYSFTTNLLTATFTDLSTSSNTIFQWLWNFGDGNTSPVQNPTHTYAVGGTYNVCLIVTDNCGPDTICQSVTVGCPTLIAAFQDTVIGFQYGGLDQSVGSPTSWLWDFGDGNTSTQQNVIHNYATAGVYTVCLTVSDGCSTDSTCTTVIIGCPIPIANYSFITVGNTVTFTDQSNNLPTQWLWDLGDGNTSTQQNVTHTYATSDTFYVCLIASNTCGADTICDTVITGCNTPIAAFSTSPTGLSVAFTDQTTNTPTNWSWDFGDGNTSTVQNPNHTYAAPGTYNVCLTASSFCGTNTTCGTVTVSCPAPLASFTQSITGNTVTFTNTSTGGATSYNWTFGDGNTSTATSPTHTYATSGNYQVCLTATSVCGSNTSCTLISTSCPTPTSNFSFTNINLSYSFTSLATGNPTSLFWTFGDGGTSTSANPTHVYANSGTYQVCLIATNTCGSDTFCIAVTANCPTPSAAYSSTANNLTVNFSDLTTGNPTSWSWNFGDGSPTSIQTNPSHTYALPGTYTVCLTATNACGQDTACMTVTVGCPAPSSSFSFVTVGNTVNFTQQASGGATNWSWNFGDGNTSSLQNPSHSYTAVGTYNVCLIASSVCGADTFCQSVIISCVPPAANFNFSVSSDSVVAFTNQASPNTTSWVWYFGDGTTSTAANPTHIYQAPGTYTACLEVINTCGRDTLCMPITITCVNPTSGYLVQVTNAVANFTDISLLPQTWFWDFGDGNTSNLQNPSHSYTQSGIYTVCLTVTNFCGTNTSCQNLVVTCSAPVPAFIFQNGVSSVSFTDQSTNQPTSWFWNFGDGNTDTVQNPIHTFLFPGNYHVCVTATNSCGSAFHCQWITVTAVGQPEADVFVNSLTIYPNPGSGLYTIEAGLPKAMDINIRVLNAVGQEVFELNEGRQVGTYSGQIDLRNVADGTYMLEIKAGETALRRTLVKQ